MFCTERLFIENKGNGSAKWKLTSLDPSIFQIQQTEGELKAGCKEDISINYYPQSQKDETDIILLIENGAERKIQVVGSVQETLCEISPKLVNFGVISICQEKVLTFKIDNKNIRTHAVFHIERDSLPQGISIKPMKGKIMPNSQQVFDVTFSCESQQELTDHEILINVRGSKRIRLGVSGTSFFPEIEMLPKILSFGEVTYGSQGQLLFEMKNNSDIPVELMIYFNGEQGLQNSPYEFLDIQTEEKSQAGHSILERQEIDQGKLGIQKSVLIYLQSRKNAKMTLFFTPQQPVTYDFPLRVCMANKQNIVITSCQVFCQGTHPRFLIEPISCKLEFPKKIILIGDAIIPQYKILSISNPDQTKPLKWVVDRSKLALFKSFTMNPLEGVIEPNSTIQIQVGFQPL